MASVSEHQRQRILKYALALAATGAALLVAFATRPYVGPTIIPPFLLAVAVAALYGGRGPGAAATVLSAAALGYWFFPALRAETPTNLAPQLMFLLIAAVITWIGGSMQDQRRHALVQAAENARLRQQAEHAHHLAEEESARARDAAMEAEIAALEAAEALARQQEAEKALRSSEAQLSDFFDTASTGLHWVAQDGTITRANRAELDMLGYAPDEYVGHHIAEFHADPPVIEDILRRLLAGETIRQYPARMRCKDGGIKYVAIDSSGYFEDGQFVHTRCFTRDVTAEREAQEAVNRLAAIVTSSTDAVVSKRLDGTITSWNAAAERIFGYPASEMVGQSIYKLIPPEQHGQEREVLERVRRGQPVESAEAERIRKDGSRIWISLSVSPVRDGEGAITGAASIKRDITERKLMDERLRDTQRLQAVGQLAGGIAHEANNQMSVVLGGAHFLLRRDDLPEAVRADVDHIRQAAERTAAITQQLLAFSRRQVLALREVNLNTVLQALAPVLRRSLSEDQELELRLGYLAGTVRADPRQLDQVLLNLTLNARDAMPQGGRLTIETREIALSLPGAAQPGLYQSLIVHDSGHGMARPVLERAFEPFFTTKGVGQGTGLGLSVVHGIVSQLGGHIQAHSAVSEGTTFTLYFPLAAGGPVPDPAAPREQHVAEPGSVALVVEDDPFVRGIVNRALTEASYGVLEAADGRAALELVRSHRGRLDLVVTDVGMPLMDGYELARCLREEFPDLPIVFMTGYGDEHGRDGAGAPGPLIQKPFAPDALVQVVGDLLQAK